MAALLGRVRGRFLRWLSSRRSRSIDASFSASLSSATILLVDHSKIGSASLFQITDWTSINKVVTDKVPKPEWGDFFKENNIDVVGPTSAGRAN